MCKQTFKMCDAAKKCSERLRDIDANVGLDVVGERNWVHLHRMNVENTKNTDIKENFRFPRCEFTCCGWVGHISRHFAGIAFFTWTDSGTFCLLCFCRVWNYQRQSLKKNKSYCCYVRVVVFLGRLSNNEFGYSDMSASGVDFFASNLLITVSKVRTYNLCAYWVPLTTSSVAASKQISFLELASLIDMNVMKVRLRVPLAKSTLLWINLLFVSR